MYVCIHLYIRISSFSAFLILFNKHCFKMVRFTKIENSGYSFSYSVPEQWDSRIL